jgi:hypothetical protein
VDGELKDREQSTGEGSKRRAKGKRKKSEKRVKGE